MMSLTAVGDCEIAARWLGWIVSTSATRNSICRTVTRITVAYIARGTLRPGSGPSSAAAPAFCQPVVPELKNTTVSASQNAPTVFQPNGEK